MHLIIVRAATQAGAIGKGGVVSGGILFLHQPDKSRAEHPGGCGKERIAKGSHRSKGADEMGL